MNKAPTGALNSGQIRQHRHRFAKLADLADELCNELHGCSISERLDEVSELKEERDALQTALDDTKDRLDRYE